jgi:hypothetical protein
MVTLVLCFASMSYKSRPSVVTVATVTNLAWSHKATLTPWPFLIYCASLSDFKPCLIRAPELRGNFQQTSSSKAAETWGLLTCRKNLCHETDGFTSPPKEVVQRIFIALRNSSSSAANLGSYGKKATTRASRATQDIVPPGISRNSTLN